MTIILSTHFQENRAMLRPFLILAISVLFLCACSHKPRTIRILAAGLSQECDTFNPVPTEEKDFGTILRGEQFAKDADWANVLKGAGAQIIPSLYADSWFGGKITKQTYEKFKAEILKDAQQAGKVDGVYLDMHGAMQVEGYGDVQADLVHSVREVVGPDAIIAGSFDLHGDISQALAKELDILTAYRTAPHVDQKETRERAVNLLLQAIRTHRRPVVALVKVPIIVPGERAVTTAEPMKSIYSQLPAVGQKPGLLDGSILIGNGWSDVPYDSISVTVVADQEADREAALHEAQRLAEIIWEHRTELKYFGVSASLDEAITTALAAPEHSVFITDSGDNVSAGTPGDTTVVLKRLKERGVKDAVVAGIADPDAIGVCEKSGVGKTVALKIGGKMDTVHSQPLSIKAVVRHLSSGPVGPSNAIGRAAVLDWDGILVVLVDYGIAFTSPADFKQVDIDPLAHKIVVVKLGYLFQALQDIAPRAIMALTPGVSDQVIERLTYNNVRRPIYPLNPDTKWSPDEAW